MRVLVAEDDKVMSQLICATLMGAGHQAIPAFDGASTMMAAIRKPPPDVIVLDLQMPAGDGAATLTKLKASTRTALIPVVVVSGTKDPKLRDSVRGLGAATFIEKPIVPEEFLAVVEGYGPRKG